MAKWIWPLVSPGNSCQPVGSIPGRRHQTELRGEQVFYGKGREKTP